MYQQTILNEQNPCERAQRQITAPTKFRTQLTAMALFLIKAFHSLVFIVESLAILYILYSGLFNVRDSWLVVSIILVLGEIIIFAANGLRCPLTKLAISLGDKTGDDYLADFLFPEWLKPLVSPICGSLALVGMVAVGLRLLIG